MLLTSKRKLAGRDLKKLAVAMDKNWKDNYALSERIEQRHMRDGVKSSFIESAVQRLAPASVDFDNDWKEKI